VHLTLELWLPKVIRDSNLNLQIDLDPGVRPIAPRMSWIHSIVSTSHFAEFRADCMRKANKCPNMSYSALPRELEQEVKVI